MLRILIYIQRNEKNIREYLSGYFCNFISNPMDMESSLIKEEFDLAIIDFDTDTLDRIDLIKNNSKHLNFPLILALFENKKPGIHRVDDFISFPFSKEELLKRISILEERRLYMNYFSDLKEINLIEAEKFLILNAVKKYNGSKSKAAKVLGISTRTIELKYRKWGLTSH